jgi:cytoskeletal protein CcmA (bactofilin family)
MFNSRKNSSESGTDSESLNSDGFKYGLEKTESSDAEGQRVLQEIIQNRSKSVYSMRGGAALGNENEFSLSGASGNMTVGPGVQMEGAIRYFENLIILGSSEGELEGENLIIGEGGWLKGTATIRNMEVVGHFQGSADVAGHILLRSSGTVEGTISYASIEIEKGGQISGEMRPINKSLNDELAEEGDLKFPQTTSTEMNDSQNPDSELSE